MPLRCILNVIAVCTCSSHIFFQPPVLLMFLMHFAMFMHFVVFAALLLLSVFLHFVLNHFWFSASFVWLYHDLQ